VHEREQPLVLLVSRLAVGEAGQPAEAPPVGGTRIGAVAGGEGLGGSGQILRKQDNEISSAGHRTLWESQVRPATLAVAPRRRSRVLGQSRPSMRDSGGTQKSAGPKNATTPLAVHPDPEGAMLRIFSNGIAGGGRFCPALGLRT
jgi:hypothetical protein